MEWLGPVAAAIITALAAGMTLVIGARIKGEWWPGRLRHAQRLTQLLGELDPSTPTAKILARERDETLQAWVLNGRLPTPPVISAAVTIAYIGAGFALVGMLSVLVMQVVYLAQTLQRTGIAGVALGALVAAVAGATIMFIAVPVMLFAPDHRRAAMRALRRSAGLGETIDIDARRTLRRVQKIRRRARRRAREARRRARNGQRR